MKLSNSMRPYRAVPRDQWRSAIASIFLVSLGCAVVVGLRAPALAYRHINPRRWEAIQRPPQIQPPKGYRPLQLPPEDLPTRPHRFGGVFTPEQRELAALTAIVVLALAAQWLSSWMRVPTALLLLVFGCLAGPVSGVIQPDLLFGHLLLPLLSVALALALFFEGLCLCRLRRRHDWPVAVRLAGVGLPVTCAITAAAAYFVLHLAVPLAVLFGLILGLTGPPGALVSARRRDAGQLGVLVNAERTISDLLGALVVVLIFEAILPPSGRDVGGASWTVLRNDVVYGLLCGVPGGLVLLALLQRNWIPRFLGRSAPLALVITVFTAANSIQAGAGYVAVAAMGVFLSSRDEVMFDYGVRLRGRWYGSLLAAVFLVLVARLRPADLLALNWADATFVATVVLSARPLAVWVSTIGSGLGSRDRLLLSLMAPRGVFAVGLATICGLALLRPHNADTAAWVPLSILVAAGTAVLCPLGAFLIRRQVHAPDAGVCLSPAAHIGDR